jgi:hypothetical protein
MLRDSSASQMVGVRAETQGLHPYQGQVPCLHEASKNVPARCDTRRRGKTCSGRSSRPVPTNGVIPAWPSAKVDWTHAPSPSLCGGDPDMDVRLPDPPTGTGMVNVCKPFEPLQCAETVVRMMWMPYGSRVKRYGRTRFKPCGVPGH